MRKPNFTVIALVGVIIVAGVILYAYFEKDAELSETRNALHENQKQLADRENSISLYAKEQKELKMKNNSLATALQKKTAQENREPIGFKK